MPTAREIAVGRIVKRVHQFPRLDPMHSGDGLDVQDARDAALALAIDHAVTRHWLTLQALIRPFVRRSWERTEADVRAALLSGAAQLFYLDRLPDHAIIHEAVEITKTRGRAKASGLVNAVLRRLAELREERVDRWSPDRADELPLPDGGAWRLRNAAFEGEPIVRLSEQTSHPIPLLSHWSSRLGWERTRALALHNLLNAPIIMTELGPIAEDDPLEPHEAPGFFVYRGTARSQLDELLKAHPGARVQDPTSAAPVEALAKRGESYGTIIDLCAGRGTKTRQLAARFPDSRIIATDVNEERLAALEESTAALANVDVHPVEHLRRLVGQADCILLDVPCSNTGVLARRVEARYRWSEEAATGLVGMQRQIIADVLPLLKPKGDLLYSTCSIEPAENQEQAAWCGSWHNFELLEEHQQFPVGLPGDEPSAYRDGGYFALMRRG